jgi:hypothetical protein
MEKILVNIICDDISTLHRVNFDGVQLLQNSLEIKHEKVYIRAIVDKEVKTQLQDICEIEEIDDMEGMDLEALAIAHFENR